MDQNIKIGDLLKVISTREDELKRYRVQYGDVVIVKDIEDWGHPNDHIINEVRVLRTGKTSRLRAFTNNGCHNRDGTLPVYERI
jgi:signal peptidase I